MMGWLRRHWRLLTVAVGSLVVGWASFATYMTAIEYTNHTEFCLNCHVMRDTVYLEYSKSTHFTNKFGVHAGCPDCHVPMYSWTDEAVAKIHTLKELYAFFFGGMSNIENFQKIRPELAKEVWAKFKATNARECRHCHDYSSMVAAEQPPSARVMHADAAKTNENCVECHKGITHKNFEEKVAAPPPTNFNIQ